MPGMPRVRKRSKPKWRSAARAEPLAGQAIRKLGNQIRSLRETKDLSQQKLAESASISVSHVSDLENGNTNPTVATLACVARALGVQVRDLFDYR